MYANAVRTDEEGDRVLSLEMAFKSTNYLAFIKAVCELQKVNVA